MDRRNINRMMQMCTIIADKADLGDVRDRDAVFRICNSGIRAVSSVMCHGISDIQMLMNEYAELKIRLETACSIQDDTNEMVETLLGQDDPTELLSEEEMEILTELCKPARDYIQKCIHKYDEEEQ